jgi:hypothetical protein
MKAFEFGHTAGGSIMYDRSDAACPRVLYCTDTYPPQVNGVSVVTELSVAGLRERGWDCMVIAPKYPRLLPTGPLDRPIGPSSEFPASPFHHIRIYGWQRRSMVDVPTSFAASNRTSSTARPSS